MGTIRLLMGSDGLWSQWEANIWRLKIVYFFYEAGPRLAESPTMVKVCTKAAIIILILE